MGLSISVLLILFFNEDGQMTKFRTPHPETSILSKVKLRCQKHLTVTGCLFITKRAERTDVSCEVQDMKLLNEF